jgi:hypothetical protein
VLINALLRLRMFVPKAAAQNGAPTSIQNNNSKYLQNASTPVI